MVPWGGRVMNFPIKIPPSIDASHKTGNNWPCGFLEVKNVKLLHDGPRQIAIGHLSEIKYTEYWILCQFGIESQHDILNR